MCGIAGFHGRAPQRAAALSQALAHRGPDASWVAEHGGYSLVQTRLAVIDRSSGVHYPMVSASGELALLFNGEIYGHRRLRRELERLGCVFRTACDAEVLLHGYEVWGEAVFGRLDGMFAAAIVERRTGALLLVRDALGIKPLVHTTGPGPFAFASDAVALVAAGLSVGELDPEALRAHLALHYVPPPRTGLRDVAQVEPGHLVRIAADGRQITRRWAPEPLASPIPTAAISAERIEATIRASVEQQLAADVPVGVFLSGGVDSAVILAAAALGGHAPVAFTIGFGAHGDYDERPLAAATAAALGITHRHEPLTGGFTETLEGVAGAFDVPFADASAIATLQLARLARREVTVALSGTGGDELFGGYARHRAHRLLGVLALIPEPARRFTAALGPSGGAERTSRAALLRSRLARLAAQDPREPLAQYLGLVGRMSSPAAVAATTFGTSDGSPGDERIPEPGVPSRMRRPLDPASSVLRELTRLDLATYLPGDVLTKEDRATMAVGLEARVPLLGRDVVALAGRLPDRQKASTRRGKIALRDLATTLVPGAAAARAPKRGFAVPLGPLLAGPWRAEALQTLRDADGVVAGDRAAAAFVAGALTPADTWMLATLSAWERRIVAARRRASHERIVRAA